MSEKYNLLSYTADETARVAFAALIHDLGKIGQRAKLEITEQEFERQCQLYAKRVLWDDSKNIRNYTHQHVAYTSKMYDEIQPYLPKDLDASPFAVEGTKQGKEAQLESLINTAALHHRPDDNSLLQWIIATADRVASGFERERFEEYNGKVDAKEDLKDTDENHYIKRRLVSILEALDYDGVKNQKEYSGYNKRIELKALNATTIMPVDKASRIKKSEVDCVAEYANLWSGFVAGLKEIPESHRQNWQLWLDHFDSLYSIYAHAVPASTIAGFNADVSLYDHSKTTASIATALYGYFASQDGYNDRSKYPEWIGYLKNWQAQPEKQLLLIQGDFYGIQDYIFTEGSKANKDSAKLLRGRSFSVSLFTELVALKVLEACALPSTSQVLNAAGKFLIVAPNTKAVVAALAQVEQEVSTWFWDNTFAVNGFGIATMPAGLNEFVAGDKFNNLMKRLFANLEEKKLRKYSGFLSGDTVFATDYSNGVCDYNKYLPAEISHKSSDGKPNVSKLSKMQIDIGEHLVKKDRILVTANGSDLQDSYSTKVIIEDFLGYKIALTKDEDKSGKFGGLAREQSLIRCWDYSCADVAGELWNGYARRYINGYVATWDRESLFETTLGKYTDIIKDEEKPQAEEIKAWDYLACDDKVLQEDQKTWLGQKALAVLKGDVDNLGAIFQQGIHANCFAKMVSVSRQINNFFAVYLPYLCEHVEGGKYKNVYTVFAGGDDFFLIGSWKTILELASKMADDFATYVAENEKVHFSSGVCLFKPGIPIKAIANMAEESLEMAKANEKNSVCVFDIPCKWDKYKQLLGYSSQLKELVFSGLDENKKQLSTSYIYGMLTLCDMAASNKPQDAIWHSYYSYRTARLFGDNAQLVTKLADVVGNNIRDEKQKYKITLMHYLYQYRI